MSPAEDLRARRLRARLLHAAARGDLPGAEAAVRRFVLAQVTLAALRGFARLRRLAAGAAAGRRA